jgi:hypothetical protein
MLISFTLGVDDRTAARVLHLPDGPRFVSVDLGQSVIVNLPGFDVDAASAARKLAEALLSAADECDRRQAVAV